MALSWIHRTTIIEGTVHSLLEALLQWHRHQFVFQYIQWEPQPVLLDSARTSWSNWKLIIRLIRVTCLIRCMWLRVTHMPQPIFFKNQWSSDPTNWLGHTEIPSLCSNHTNFTMGVTKDLQFAYVKKGQKPSRNNKLKHKLIIFWALNNKILNGLIQ